MYTYVSVCIVYKNYSELYEYMLYILYTARCFLFKEIKYLVSTR